MDWIKENKFLAGFIAVFVIGVAGLGYLLMAAKGGFTSTMETYQQSANAVAALRARPLFPEEDSLDLIDEKSAELDASTDALQTKLGTYQRPLDASMDDRSFQEKLTERVLAVKTMAVRRNAVLPDDFALGMVEYTSAFPRSEAVAELDYQLDALEYVTTALIQNGVTEITGFDREKLPVESAAAAAPDEEDAKKKMPSNAPEPAPAVTHRYPVKVSFKISPGGLEAFLNDIGNTPPGSFYLSTRLLALENEADLGPERGVPFEARIIEESIEEVIEEVEESAAGDDAAGDSQDDPGNLISADESKVAREDSRIIIGTELLEVSTVIDLLRFDPVAAKAPAEEDESPAAGDAASGA